MPPSPTPEQQARVRIDDMLALAGWEVQNVAGMNLAASPGVAVREFQTTVGPCDYMLFVDGKPAGILEAKKAGTPLGGVEAQTEAYAKHVPAHLPVPIRPLPFLYESTGTETFFTNALDPTPRARAVFAVHRPETLRGWLKEAVAFRAHAPDAPAAPSFLARLAQAPPLVTTGMWPAQIRAVQNIEASIVAGKPRALVQMATGSGKTFTAISSIYRLIRHGDCKRVLFLVDRGNLGKQAKKEFDGWQAPDDGRKFPQLYPVTWLNHNKIDPVNRVVITTIQRLYSILSGQPEPDEEHEEGSQFDTAQPSPVGALHKEPLPVVYNAKLPPDFFDVIVVDECHRSIYTLWRQVLEYFDATVIGLTATPAKHTFGFFHKNLVMEYRHEHAVRDKVNVPFQVYEIRTRIGTQGATVTADENMLGYRDRLSKQVRWEKLDDDFTYAAEMLDRQVVTPDQIRTVVREFKDKLYTEIFPGRRDIPKTLFFAKSDDHAEDILRIVRHEFDLGAKDVVKITYKPERAEGDAGRVSGSHKPEDLIQAFRNSYSPRIAVTVDMIAVGTDIKPLECVVFMRMVKSRQLFEQMKGRGVRVMPDADFQAVTIGCKTKTHFVVVDCVGVCLADKGDSQPLDRKRTVTLEKILQMVSAGNRDEEVIATLAARLDRIERKLTADQHERIESVSGGPGNGVAKGPSLHDLVAELVDAIDPDREDEAARAKFGLAEDVEPTKDQLAAVQAELRETAAAPIAYNPALRDAILEVRKAQEQVYDDVSVDEVTRSARARQYEIDHAGEVVAEFKSYVEANRAEIEALSVLYARPWKERPTRAQIKALAAAIQKPPRTWTPEKVWAAYEQVERGRVKGKSAGRTWTDLVSLVRFAVGADGELVPFADQVRARFESWLAQQGNRGKMFTTEQAKWLTAMAECVAADAEVRVEDLDDTPFAQLGGRGKGAELFGDGLAGLVDELNRELVA